jgi:hypothetical protein
VVGSEHAEEIMTAGEQLIERGVQRGLERGRREMQEETLLRVLRIRFGALPEAVVARVHGAESAQVSAWFDRAVTAPTLQDVLDGV